MFLVLNMSNSVPLQNEMEAAKSTEGQRTAFVPLCIIMGLFLPLILTLSIGHLVLFTGLTK
jgi:hypothetical protein